MIASGSVVSRSAPSLLKHCRGHYFVRLPGGKSKWFGADPAQAQTRYERWVETYQPGHNGHPRVETSLSPRFRRRMATVQEVADSLFALVDSESGEFGRRKVRACLVRFLAQHGGKEIASLKGADLIAFKGKMTADGLAASTMNDALTYARRLLTFAFDNDFVEKPFKLANLKNVGRGAVKSKAVSPDKVRQVVEAVGEYNQNLARMMLLQFYGVMRPSELPKVLYQQGEEQGRGVFSVVGKTTRKTGELRDVLLSDSALKLLKVTEPKYANGNGYRHQCWVVGRRLRRDKGDGFIKGLIGEEDLSPHFLRHSSVQALIDADVREEHIRTAMGRLKARVDRVYGKKPNHGAARESLQVLAQLIPLSTVGIEK